MAERVSTPGKKYLNMSLKGMIPSPLGPISANVTNGANMKRDIKKMF